LKSGLVEELKRQPEEMEKFFLGTAYSPSKIWISERRPQRGTESSSGSPSKRKIANYFPR
jgi:hypothetical protein